MTTTLTPEQAQQLGDLLVKVGPQIVQLVGDAAPAVFAIIQQGLDKVGLQNFPALIESLPLPPEVKTFLKGLVTQAKQEAAKAPTVVDKNYMMVGGVAGLAVGLVFGVLLLE